MRWLNERRRRRIEKEIELEFDFHVERCADALRADGLSPDAAHAEAIRRFGDRARHRDSCRREAPEGSMRTVTRWSTGLVVVALVVVVAWLGVTVTRQATLLRDLDAPIVSIAPVVPTAPVALTAPGDDARAAFVVSPPDASGAPVVRVGGAVARPGAYHLPEHATLTASQLVDAAGGGKRLTQIHVLPGSDAANRLDSWRGLGESIATVHGIESMTLVHHEAMGLPPRDLLLRAGDLIWVEPVAVEPVPDPVAGE